MFSIKPGPRNLPIDNPTLLSWNITDGDLNSKLNTLVLVEFTLKD